MLLSAKNIVAKENNAMSLYLFKTELELQQLIVFGIFSEPKIGCFAQSTVKNPNILNLDLYKTNQILTFDKL